MRARALAAAAIAAFACGCRKSAAPTGTALYASRDGSLSCRAPERWRVLESLGGAQRVTFVGPSDGPRPYSQSVGIYFYGPGSAFASPEDYARGQALAGGRTEPLEKTSWNGAQAYALTTSREAAAGLHTRKTETRVEKALLIPRRDGFYAVIYSSPKDSAPSGERVFTSVVQTLRLDQPPGS